jgi:ribosomal protein L19
MDIIATLEPKSPDWGKTIPTFAPGDTVIVNVSVVEASAKRAGHEGA